MADDSGARLSSVSLAGTLRLSSRGLMAELTRSGSSEFDPVTTIITD